MTAVEWLENELKKIPFVNPKEVFEQAKEMEKQEHHKTWLDSTCQFDNSAEMTYKKSFEDYYQENYGSKGSVDHIVDTNEMVSSQTEISDEVDRIMDLAEKSRNAINDVAHLCSGKVEEHIFDMGFYSGFNLARETYVSKGSETKTN